MNELSLSAGFSYGDPSNSRLYPDTWDAFGFYSCVCSAGFKTPYSLSSASQYSAYPTTGPRGMLNGYPMESPSLPGYRGYECNERNCPTGNRLVLGFSDQTPPGHGGQKLASGSFEIQRVICRGPASSTVFVLYFYGNSISLSGSMTAADIKTAVEYPATVGNVTISFPRQSIDGIATACDSSTNTVSGGFQVTFNTNLGTSIPMLTVMSNNAVSLSVVRDQKSTLVSTVALVMLFLNLFIPLNTAI